MLKQAAAKDFDVKVRQLVEDSSLPPHLHAFLIEKAANMDSYSFLVLNCLAERDNCKKNMFDMVVEAELGSGSSKKTIQYQCATELKVQQKRKGLFVRNQEGDIKLEVGNCVVLLADVKRKALVSTSSRYEKPSLQVIGRSGYDSGDPLEISLNEQTDFLEMFEDHRAYQEVSYEVDSSETVSRNAEVATEVSELPVVQPQYSAAPQLPSQPSNRVHIQGLSAKPKKVSIPRAETLNFNMGKSTPVKNLARYCEVEKGEIVYSCFNSNPTYQVGSRCFCELTGDFPGHSRL